MTNKSIPEVISEAIAAANLAAKDSLEKNGEIQYAGDADVVIPGKYRKLIEYLKTANLGHISHRSRAAGQSPGYYWTPDISLHSQSWVVNHPASKAAAEVLKSYGFDVFARCYYD